MANQKEYKIVINGITTSINEVDALIAKLDSLGKTIDNLSKVTINVDTSALQESANIQQEIVDKQKAQTDASKETLVTLEQQKQANKEILADVKAIASGAKDMDGNYTNTLAGMRKELADMKKELAGVEVGSDAFNDLIQKTNELNNKVKEVEQSYGVFSRNVGNYSSAIDGLNGLTVTIGGVETSFNTAREASKELNNEMTTIASRMKELQDSGQGASEEFNTLKGRFADLAQAQESISKASDYATRLKETLQDDSGAFGEIVRGFEELNSVVGVGVGVMGLFGETSEDTQKAINRTVQVMTVMQSIQKLLNKELQAGGVINKAYQATLGTLNVALNGTNASAKTASLGMKAFSGALVATGIGALVVGLGLLIEHFDDLCDWAKEAGVDFGALSSVWDETKNIAMGLGNVILQWIIGPVKTAVEVIKELAEGDFNGAFEAMTNGIKNQYDVVSNFQDGYRKQEKKNQENHAKEMQKQREKDLQNQIDYNEAKYGNDWKYTEEARKLYDEMFNIRMSQYAQDSDEYRQAQNDKLRYDREFSEHEAKKTASAKKASADRLKNAQDNAKKIQAVEDKIQDNELAIMKDGYQKKLAQLKIQRERELRDAKEQGIKVAELQKSINAKYNAEEQKLTENFWNGVNDSLKNAIMSLNESNVDKNIEIIQNKIATLTESSDKLLTNAGKGNSPLDIIFGKTALETLQDNLNNARDKIKTFYENISIIGNNAHNGSNLFELFQAQSLAKSAKEINALGKQGKEAGELLREGLGSDTKKEIVDVVREIEGMYKMFSNTKNISAKGFANLVSQFEKEKEKFDGIIKSLGETNALRQPLEKYSKLMEETLKSVAISTEGHNKRMLDYESSFASKISKAYTDMGNQMLNISKQSLSDIDAVYENFNQNQMFGLTPKQISEAKKSYQLLSNTIKGQVKTIESQIKEITKAPKRYGLDISVSELAQSLNDAFNPEVMRTNAEEYNTVYKLLEKYNKELAISFEESVSKSIGSNLKLSSDVESTLFHILNEMRGFESDLADLNGVKNSLNGLIKVVDGKLEILGNNWREKLANIMSFTAPILQDYISAISDALDMAINNANVQLEKEMDEIDDTIDALEEQLDKVTEIYEKHNDRVNELEGMLADARGDRRTELLNEISEEMTQREKAWAQEQKIQKQEEALNKRKEALQKQEDANELKRKKQQKVASIAQATVNTALAVTNALQLQPFYLGIAMAAVAGALGAVQIATIASQQFANGGVIEGASHAQGGVKVLGGTAEVEGGEYITNKKTTAKNIGVLSYINSQDKALTLADFENYFASKGKYTSSGMSNKVKFAQGGQLQSPTFDVRAITSQIRNDNRPVVVSVVDILDAEDNLRQVQTLAGMYD